MLIFILLTLFSRYILEDPILAPTEHPIAVRDLTPVSVCCLLHAQRTVSIITVWDAEKEDVVTSCIALLGGLADAVGLVELDGRVGHHGAQGCRIGCKMTGMHKPNSGHYCAVHLSPSGANPDLPIRHDFDFQNPSVGSKRDTPQIYADKQSQSLCVFLLT